jgi:hypothetical protein
MSGFVLVLAPDVGEFSIQVFDGLDVFRLRWFETYVGFVWHLVAHGFEAVEVFDCPAVLRLGMGAVTEHEADGVRFLRYAALPSDVRGPVDCFGFSRFAAGCCSLTFIAPV